MKRILFAIAALFAIAVSAPASAQVLVAPTPGIGVQVGPLGLGVWPDYGTRPYWGGNAYYEPYGSYGYEPYGPVCHVVRTRIVTPNGGVIWRARRVCD
jgi:hypothetical protein